MGIKKNHSYVNKRVKEFLHPLLRMDICREIRQHFAPRRFLEVLDCSKQSLNQVNVKTPNSTVSYVLTF
jgi:hypothetical protein